MIVKIFSQKNGEINCHFWKKHCFLGKRQLLKININNGDAPAPLA
jgi:hypothetical protein